MTTHALMFSMFSASLDLVQIYLLIFSTYVQIFLYQCDSYKCLGLIKTPLYNL